MATSVIRYYIVKKLNKLSSAFKTNRIDRYHDIIIIIISIIFIIIIIYDNIQKENKTKVRNGSLIKRL